MGSSTDDQKPWDLQLAPGTGEQGLLNDNNSRESCHILTFIIDKESSLKPATFFNYVHLFEHLNTCFISARINKILIDLIMS